MIIISHRGFWVSPGEKNTEKALRNSFNSGFGLETDIRDYNSEIVISHDIPHNNILKLNLLFELYYDTNLFLALNIKSDGLQEILFKSISDYKISSYFVFDMSIPETKRYVNMGFNVFCRQSEYETNVPFYSDIKGIWLDAFEDIWYNEDLILDHLDRGKKVCIVSSELHNRDHLDHWRFLDSINLNKNENLILCTDYPQEAMDFFNRKKR